MTKTLSRSGTNRVLGGVCSGLANYFNIDPTIMRILFLVAFFGFGAGPLIYIILWLVMPEGH